MSAPLLQAKPAANRRVSSEAVVEAYRATGSVWKAAQQLGLCGQSVWERLRALGHPLPSSRWTVAEVTELRHLAATCPIGEIARRLGRTYAGVALKMSRLDIPAERPRTPHRRRGIAKAAAARYMALLPEFRGSLRQFARAHGVAVDVLVDGLQLHHPETFEALAKARGLETRQCEYCLRTFYPMGHRQRTCSRRCQAHARSNRLYFGGRRQDAIGMAEGVCQLCEQRKDHGLSAHHVIGKEHDAENAHMVALCPGCHQIVERLAARKLVEDPAGWENLLQLVLARRHGAAALGQQLWTSVEFEWQPLDDEEEIA